MRALAALARPMAFYSLFALLALCSGASGQTVSPTTSPSPTPSPSCSAPPGFYCSGGAALICTIGAFCAGGSARNVSCYPVTACTVAGLSAQPACIWNASTFAGNGTFGFGGLTAPVFATPYGIALNGSTVVFADAVNNLLRAVSPAGLVSTLVGGNGTNAFGYLNAVGTSTLFRSPMGVSASGATLYVGDNGNGALRSVGPNGAVSTLATGLGSIQYVAASSTAVFATRLHRHTISRVLLNGSITEIVGTPSLAGYANGVGSNAKFNNVLGLTLANSSFLFCTEIGGHTVRSVKLVTMEVNLVAGKNGSQGYANGFGSAARFSSPQGIAASNGFLFVVENMGSRIRMISPDSFVSLIVGSPSSSRGLVDGLGALALFTFPHGVAVSPSGVLYVADGGASGGNAIRQLSCTPCPAGSFCSNGAVTLCPAGSFCPLGSASPTACYASTFSSAPGSETCQQCPGGHFCPAGTSSWARLNCGRGNYCPDGSGTPTPCPYQVPPTGGWGDMKVQGPAFLVETAHCRNHCFWNFTTGDGMLSQC